MYIQQNSLSVWEQIFNARAEIERKRTLMKMAKSENNKLLAQVNKICASEVCEEVESIMTFELWEVNKLKNRVNKIDSRDPLDKIHTGRDLFTSQFCDDFEQKDHLRWQVKQEACTL